MTTEEINGMFNDLNKVSKTFCLAKYDQFSLYLHLQTTHSCHLSFTKFLNEKNIEKPFDFFNFKEIKNIRKKMKEGHQVADCGYCWRIENNTKMQSERGLKSLILKDRFEEIKNMDPEDDIIPSYLEVSFSNVCNFKCSYCNLNFSSRWENDLEKYGDFKLSTEIYTKDEFFNRSNNKCVNDPLNLVNKFMIFFPEILKHLKILRITGGEPTIQPHLYKILDFIIENPQPNLHLSINTNLGANDKIINKFVNKLKEIENKVEKINIFTSCDSYGEDAEFLREGLNYEKWKKNCYLILKEVKNSNVNIMCTLNNLCLTNNFIKFLEDVYDMTEYSIGSSYTRTYFNMDVLVVPKFQAIDILDLKTFGNIVDKIENKIKTMEVKRDENGNIASKGFSKVEINRFLRVKEIITLNNIQIKKNLKIMQKDFLSYIKQISARNKKDYLKIFHEQHYQDFFNKIENNVVDKEKKDFFKIF